MRLYRREISGEDSRIPAVAVASCEWFQVPLKRRPGLSGPGRFFSAPSERNHAVKTTRATPGKLWASNCVSSSIKMRPAPAGHFTKARTAATGRCTFIALSKRFQTLADL